MPKFTYLSRKMLKYYFKEFDLSVSALIKNPCKPLLCFVLFQFYEIVQILAFCDINNLDEETELYNVVARVDNIKGCLRKSNKTFTGDLLGQVINAFMRLRNSIGHRCNLLDGELLNFNELLHSEDSFMVYISIIDLWIPKESVAYEILKSKLFLKLYDDIIEGNDIGYSECYSLASKLLKVVDGRSEYTVGEAKFQLLRRGFAEGVVDKVLVALLYTHDVVA